MIRVLRALVAACLAMLVLTANARSLWLVQDGRLVRIDPGAAAVQTVPLRESVRSIAPLGAGGAWVLTENSLRLVDESLVERAHVAVSPEDARRIGPIASDPYDGGVWFGLGGILVQVDGAGIPLRHIAFDGPVLAIAVVGPEAIFAATAKALARIDARGEVVTRFDLSVVAGEGVAAMLADPLAGYLWLLRHGALVQFEVLAGPMPRAILPVAGPDAIAIEPRSGMLSVVSGREVARYDRSALPVPPNTFLSEALLDPAGIDVHAADARILFGDRAGLGTIDLVNGAVRRVSGPPGVERFAPDPLRFEPRLEIDVSANAAIDTSTALTLRFRAYCDGIACTVSPAYFRDLRFRALKDDVDVSAAFSADSDLHAFSGHVNVPPWQLASPLRAWVADSFGNRSPVAVVTWPVIASNENPQPQFLPKAAGMVTITAPANDASFTAPANTTIKATATPSTGATITKVDFYAGATLLGTVTAAPYNLAWSNVQVGTYALTAKQTDSLGATATSAVVNVTVTAGALANALNAYLLNDAWPSSGVVTDAAGNRNGTSTGTVTAVSSAALAPKPDTCKAANFAGGAIDVAGLTVSTSASAKTTLAFWMYWNGTNAVMPVGWVSQGLLLSGGAFGFTTLNSDVFGIASTGLANKWHHIVAEFNNGATASGKLYVNGVPQVLAQRTGTPNSGNAVVAAMLRIGGLSGNSGYRFAGQLDEIRVFNRALTATEVSAEFAAANPCGTAPTVALTAPANNTSFVAPASISMTANAAASAAGATLRKVEFYNGSTLLATSTASPHAFTWSNVAAGTYSLTAKATDSKGATATSNAATAVVKANVAPAVSITAPANNAAYTAPATINIAANATDTDGAVAKVEFYQGSTKLATLTAAPYTYAWNSVGGGTYALTAKATDDRGAVTTSATVTVKVNKPPTISITAPANNAVIVMPSTVAINATAVDADGTIAKVEFFRDGVLLATDTASPYSYTWTVPSPGTYVLTAKATDNLGAVTTSGAVTLTANANQLPTVAITSPAAGAQIFAGVPTTISATAADADGTISKVEFYADPGTGPYRLATDTTSPYSISASLNVGTNILTAVATDNKGGARTSASVTVTAKQNQLPSVSLTAPNDQQYFISPSGRPNVTLSAVASDSDGRVVAVRFYKQSVGVNGDPNPVLLGTVSSPPYQMTWSSVPYTDPPPGGVNVDGHMVWAEATDDIGGVMASDPAAIYVLAVAPPSPYVMQMTRPARHLGNQPLVFGGPATIVLSAGLVYGGSAVGVATSVDFAANGTVIGTISPGDITAAGDCLFVWRNVSPGSYSVTASLVDYNGFRSPASEPISITVEDPPSATVTMQSPPRVQVVALVAGIVPPAIPFAATLSDPKGAMLNIAFQDSYEFLATLSAAPYGGTIANPRRGIHYVTAVGLDVHNRKVRSAPSFVGVPLAARAPVAVLTSPSPTGSYSSSLPIAIIADVVSPDGAIAKVEFYDGPYLIGSDTTAPYTISAYLSGGTHSIQALAYTAAGTGPSAPLSVSVSGTGAASQITLTSPTDDQLFFVPASVPLAVTVTDPNHAITKVEYWRTSNSGATSTLIGTATQAPWTIAPWAVGSPGNYTLTAVGLFVGGRVTSAPVAIRATSNQPPAVSIASPVPGQRLYLGQTAPIVVSASDPDGTIAKVEFFVNGTPVGSDTIAPYAFDWTPAATGNYTLSAKATDALGMSSTTTPFTVSVDANLAPTVALVLPLNGAQYAAGGTISLVATAADGDGTIQRVDFYSGSTLLGSSLTSPYRFVWTNVPAGAYSLTARVVDDRGAVTTSAAVNATVQALTLTVSSPADNSSTSADFVLVSGTYQGPANSGVTVNGVAARTDGQGNFFANNVPLAPGSNAITIQLNAADGSNLAVTRTVTSSGSAPFQISLDADSGFAPMATTLRVVQRGTVKWVNLAFTGLGPGVLDTTGATNEAPARITYATPGTYKPQFTLTDATGNIYTQTVQVTIKDRIAFGAVLKSAWNGFAGALAGGDKQTALSALGPMARTRYGPVLDALEGHLGEIIANWTAPKLGTLGDDVGELTVTRNIDGVKRLFFIYMVKDRRGIWRLENM